MPATSPWLNEIPPLRPAGPAVSPDDARAAAWERYRQVRAVTEALASGLAPEDQVVQSMADASPTKWHRAHTAWFFESFVLQSLLPGYRVYDPRYGFLFNSYYEAKGGRHPRPRRGLLTRPTVAEVAAYRRHVDEGVERVIGQTGDDQWPALAALIELGLNHEQQHQELILTDLLHLLSCNPLWPAAYPLADGAADAAAAPMRWVTMAGGSSDIGASGEGFAYDNEGPRHTVHLAPFRLASRLVTNAEYGDFIADGGYRRPEPWLADGWAAVQEQGWTAPAYWIDRDDAALVFTLGGLKRRDPAAPVCHVSYYEADAYARWAGKRLPTEQEWETVAARLPCVGNFLETGAMRPVPAPGIDETSQMFGDAWEWTASAYLSYPGFRPAAGAVGEYNGKFMCNQMVLRGGSCITPGDHVRASYRNFFYPSARWQFSGIRLAEDA